MTGQFTVRIRTNNIIVEAIFESYVGDGEDECATAQCLSLRMG